ncbi:MAG: (deoxy)nucleoside triphosphate pyrophosphohydrolase [Eggerthellaceae bacterium]|nr:(deoxy)nucleoside triphosphate pyrophosphohydrolase [Eggerthellaceae bacterium]
MKTIDVVAAIIKQHDRILATQRGHGDHAGGWEFPGGKIELGETPEQAIVREIREELEATISVDQLVTVIDHFYETFHLHMHCFLCHVTDGELKLHEHRAARWLDAGTLDSVDWLPADVKVVQAIKDQGILG